MANPSFSAIRSRGGTALSALLASAVLAACMEAQPSAPNLDVDDGPVPTIDQPRAPTHTAPPTTDTTEPGAACSFDAPNRCESADGIDAIAGDAGQDVRIVRGTGDAWLKLLVRETGLTLAPVRYTVALESPEGSDYELAVYRGTGDGPLCTGKPAMGQGDAKMVSVDLSDIPLVDQSEWITIEVVHVSGTDCTSTWTVRAIGDYAPKCVDDGRCASDDACVCGDCADDAYCSNAANCVDDGVCDPSSEGCGCGDCAKLPPCL